MKVKLTVRSVEAVEPSDKDIIVWDKDLAGFGLKVTPTGRRTYFLYYRTAENQQRRPTIGSCSVLKPEAARTIAKRWLAEVAAGRDPSLTRQLDRVAPTVATLCERYMEDYAKDRKKPSSIRSDERLIKAHILPTLGSRKIGSVTRADISAMHSSMRATPYEANRTLALASKMFSLSERWGLRPDGSNPAKNVDRFNERKRERYLTPDEIGSLWKVLHSDDGRAVASESAIAAIKLLILTGRRLSEILTLEWRWVDLSQHVLRLPDTKTGALTVALNGAAVALLEGLRLAAPNATFVIAGRRKGRPLINLQKPWRALRALAGLNDVRIHDLRHTFASVGAGLGMSLPLLGRLLGHTQVATTSRYAHLAQQPVKQAADDIGDALERFIAIGAAAA